MSFLERLLRLIDRPRVHGFVDRKREAIESIDPERIYVENVRALFGLSHTLTRVALEAAVREGALERRIGVVCPYDGHIVKSFSSEEVVPESVSCLVCEVQGREQSEHLRDELGRVTFYRLVSSDD